MDGPSERRPRVEEGGEGGAATGEMGRRIGGPRALSGDKIDVWIKFRVLEIQFTVLMANARLRFPKTTSVSVDEDLLLFYVH